MTGEKAISYYCKLLLVICSCLLKQVQAQVSPHFGVTFGRASSNLPRSVDVADLVAEQGIGRVRILDAEPSVTRAFARSPVKMCVTLPNEMIFCVATSMGCTRTWFYQHIFPYMAQVETILIGDEVLTSHPEMAKLLTPAMENLYFVLLSMGMHQDIKVSTPHSMELLESINPPSSGSFRRQHHEVLRRTLKFLLSTNSFFAVNIYPYYVYQLDKGRSIALDYALGNETAVAVRDPQTGFNYTSLLMAEVDAVYSAMGKLGYKSVRLLISETGWPSAGGYGASKKKSFTFFCNLVNLVSSEQGTPLKPQYHIQAYHFALFNEDLRNNVVDQSFGIFYPNRTQVYPHICTTG